MRICIFLLLFFTYTISGTAKFQEKKTGALPELHSFLKVAEGKEDSIDLHGLVRNGIRSHYYKPNENFTDRRIVWFEFSLKNISEIDYHWRLAVPFCDSAQLYAIHQGKISAYISGDNVPYRNRSLPVSTICYLPIEVEKGAEKRFILKLTYRSGIARDFQNQSVESLKLITSADLLRSTDDLRISQSFFYGGLITLLFFNLIICFYTKSSGYISYVVYLSSFTIFIASNQGYLLQFLLFQYPKTDLAIRFLSTPILIISYTEFSRRFLSTQNHFPKWDRWLKYGEAVAMIAIFIMVLINWRTGRTMIILLSAIVCILILMTTLQAVLNKYRPAFFFLAGNIVLLVAGIIYALERVYSITPVTSGSLLLQTSTLIEVVMFSLGLADNINVSKQQLVKTQLEKETREKELEKEKFLLAEQKNKELNDSNQQLDTFIYRTAHDIKGPLATMMGITQVALLDVKNDIALQYLLKLNNTANKMNYLLNRLTTAHQIANHDVKLEYFNIKDLTNKVVEEFDIVSFSDELKLITDVDDAVINSDRILLFNILSNLLENALKFKKINSQFPHMIFINIYIKEKNLKITIEDNGIGIPEEDSPYIFDLFSRAAIKYKSAGIGLYIVKSSLQKIGGHVEFISAQDRTLFNVLLPSVIA